MKLTKKDILKKLEEVIDPELNISIVDLGLVYDVKIDKKNNVKIIMTLTTIGCPLISVIEEDIKNKISELGFLKEKIIIDLTFDPPWTIEKMSEKAKAILGII
ncbi:MAG: metal-sulfur cluster assembly factor [Patescibacteria group bacterium]|nr:metal-sulfur cluster assembly factor [Patescibacteria group bacterium]